MRRTHALGPSAIVLIVFALLVSGAGFAVRSPGEARVLIAAAIQTGTSSVGRAHGLSSDADGAARTEFVRPASPTITRGHAPSSGGSGDARGAFALGASPPPLEGIALRTTVTVEAHRDGVGSPGQPAPSSRAPPVG